MSGDERGGEGDDGKRPSRDSLPQLTARALITGAVIGAITGVSNLYVGLKVGWSLGVVLTASVVGWTAWQAARRLRLLKSPPSILEAGMMASTASAAGYSTGTTLVAAMAAWLLLTGHHLPLWQLMTWLAGISALGLWVAMALRRQLIVEEALPFPTGAVAAEMLESLAAEDEAASRRASALWRALAVGLVFKAMTAVMPVLVGRYGWPPWLAWPAAVPTPAMADAVPALSALVTYGFVLEVSPLLPAAGVLVGWRVGWSLMLGSVVCFGVLAPRLVADGSIAAVGYGAMVQWSVWPGATLMTVASLLSFGLRRESWRAVAAVRRSKAGTELSAGTLRTGLALAGLACVIMQIAFFDIPWALALLSVVLAGALAVVAARVTGETDTTPMGPLGKVAQLAFGVAMPGRPLPNLMVASVTAGAAASAADLLTDLKAGHRLGLSPPRQLVAQAVGVVVGVVVIVPVFRYVLVPDASVLGTAQWPAPAAKVWASVAELLGRGLDALPAGAGWAVVVAAGLAVGLVLIERWRPQWKGWLPSATGLGLAFVLPASTAMGFFVGGAVAGLVRRRWPESMGAVVIPVAAGLIAGESLMGVVSAVVVAGG